MISHQIVFHVTFMGGSTKKKIFYNMSGFTRYLCVYIYLLYKKNGWMFGAANNYPLLYNTLFSVSLFMEYIFVF